MTTFGVGDRNDLLVSNIMTPSPFNYNLQSTFKPRKASFSGNTLGAPRKSYDNVVGMQGWNHQPHDRNFPGPGQY